MRISPQQLGDGLSPLLSRRRRRHKTRTHACSHDKKIIGVGFWTYCLRKSTAIFLGRTATIERILSAHVSDAVLDELAHDRKLELDHDDSTQFNIRVSKRYQHLHRPCAKVAPLPPLSWVPP